MTGQEKNDHLMQVTAWAGLTVYICLITYIRTIPPCSVNFSSLPQLYFNKDISTCNFSMVKLKVYVQGSMDISVAIGRLISLMSVQQDSVVQLDGM